MFIVVAFFKLNFRAFIAGDRLAAQKVVQEPIMDMHQILFLPHNKKVEVPDGENLIRAAMEAGVHINASCGGEGVCGKCRVIIESGEVAGGITPHLSPEDQEKGYRQACLASVKSDLVVRIPIESEVDASVLNMQSTPRSTARIKQMNFDDLKERGLFVPPVEKRYLELPAPNAQDNQADISRLVNFLQIEHDEHMLEVDLSVIKKIPTVMREADFKITATLARPVREVGKNTHYQCAGRGYHGTQLRHCHGYWNDHHLWPVN